MRLLFRFAGDTVSEQKTILVIEDSAAARDGLTAVLRHAGYDVYALGDGKQGLDFIRSRHRPDLILLDMLLPVLDGWKFLEELEQWSRPPKVPIVVTTGTILTAEWAAQRGCAGFLRKPIDETQLLAVVERCLA